MIIVNSNGGQLCNKIWSYAAMVAYSLRFKTSLYILDFDDYIPFFENLKSLPNVHFVKNKYLKKSIRLLVRIYIRILPTSQFNYSQKCNGIFSCNGWEFRTESLLLSEYRDSVCKLFTPQSKFVLGCANFINSIRNERVLVGVHIRRKDYKNHLNGAYFFDNEIYYSKMLALNDEIINKLNKSVAFVICSDEKVIMSDFSELNCYQLKDASSIEDLYCLAKCDYIIGVPSTFSMWASFYGRVPLCFLDSKSKEVELNQFKVIEAVDRFVDGSFFEHSIEI